MSATPPQSRALVEADRFRGCLLGLATGDAVGTTVEFQSRGTFEPVTDLVGGGPFGLEPGQWTDDTSMALCLGTSLVQTGGFDATDQMDRYCAWQDRGYLASNGVCFDIGNTVHHALSRYRGSGDPLSGPTDPRSAGNGSIMRLAPIPIYTTPRTPTPRSGTAVTARAPRTGQRNALMRVGISGWS